MKEMEKGETKEISKMNGSYVGKYNIIIVNDYS